MKESIAVKGSSTITRIGYDAEKKMLTIVFTSGKVYGYTDVPRHIWEAFKAEIESGGSAGTFFNYQVRNKFDYYPKE